MKTLVIVIAIGLIIFTAISLCSDDDDDDFYHRY